MIRKIAVFSLLTLIFTIPWEAAITFSALGTLTRVIGLGAAGIWIIAVLVEGKLRNLQIFHIFAFFFVALNVASIIWTVDYELTFSRVKTYIQLAILTWLLWDLISTPETFRAAMQIFILGGYVAVASAISNFISGQLISDTEFGRYTGANQNAVEFAMILSVCLPIAWHLATTQKPGRGANIWKAINFAFIPASFLAIILTASRTGLITVVPGVLYILGTMNQIKYSYRFLIFIIFISIIFSMQSFVPQVTLDRLGTIGSSISTGDVGGRMRLWEGTITIFMKHPLLGIGSLSLASPNQLGVYAHNTFLSILAELGIVGFLVFMGLLATVVYGAINQSKPYAVLWIAVFFVWLISIQSLTWEYSKPTWFILNMVIISAGINIRHGTLPGRISQLNKPVGDFPYGVDGSLVGDPKS